MLPVLGTTVALAAALPSVAAGDTGAANTAGFDPQGANAPYLAWTGETIRLEKCIPNIYGMTGTELAALGAQASFTVQSWTGGSAGVQLQAATIKLFVSESFDEGTGGICAIGDVAASTPGLAQIELGVTGLAEPNGSGGYGPPIPFGPHEFLAGWMQLDQPTLHHMSASDFAGDPGGSEINDGSGSGNTTPGPLPDYLDVTVTGTIPLSGNPGIAQMVGRSSVTLPQDWAVLANALAVDDSANGGGPGTGNAADMWDTSGDSGDTSGHLPGACDLFTQSAGTLAAPVIAGDSGDYVSPLGLDNGDNCWGGGADGPFSFLSNGQTALSTSTAVGPFDPTDAADTSLPNGDLNAQDAPMPAALVDLAIAPNSGSSADISGVGSLQPADKTITYSRDFLGDSAPGNLFAPFYDAYIPATARPTDSSSGIDGASGSDFTGFVDIPGNGSFYQYGSGISGLYHFWDTAALSSNAAAATNCFDSDPNPPSGGGAFRHTPSGPGNVEVYTDQNGEAQVRYVPGEGYYFDHLPGIAEGGGCDLQNIQGGVLGTASITATAESPYRPSSFPHQVSGPVTETVHSLFDDALSYTSATSQNERIVISHGQDIDGTPFAGDTVCFTTSTAVGVTQFTGSVNGVSYGNATPVPDPAGGSGQGRYCLKTGGNGNAAIAVSDTNPQTVNVIAEDTNHGLPREISVDFATPGSSGGTPPSSAGGTQPVPQPGSPGTTSGTQSHTLVRHLRRPRITLVRLIRRSHRRPYVLLRVRSTHRRARVAMTVRLRSGRHLHSVHRTITVRTDRTVKLLVPKSAVRIKGVHLIG